MAKVKDKERILKAAREVKKIRPSANLYMKTSFPFSSFFFFFGWIVSICFMLEYFSVFVNVMFSLICDCPVF